MSQTKEGALKAKARNIEKYGSDYYSVIGTAGAKAYKERQIEGIAKPRGFQANRELAVRAGAKGGRISRRRKSESL